MLFEDGTTVCCYCRTRKGIVENAEIEDFAIERSSLERHSHCCEISGSFPESGALPELGKVGKVGKSWEKLES